MVAMLELTFNISLFPRVQVVPEVTVAMVAMVETIIVKTRMEIVHHGLDKVIATVQHMEVG